MRENVVGLYRKYEENPNNFTWKLMVDKIETKSNKVHYYQLLLTRLAKADADLGNDPLLKDWLGVRNRMRSIQNRLKDISREKRKEALCTG